MMELQRLQAQALQTGDCEAVAEFQTLIFEKLEDAQSEARLSEAA